MTPSPHPSSLSSFVCSPFAVDFFFQFSPPFLSLLLQFVLFFSSDCSMEKKELKKSDVEIEESIELVADSTQSQTELIKQNPSDQHVDKETVLDNDSSPPPSKPKSWWMLIPIAQAGFALSFAYDTMGAISPYLRKCISPFSLLIFVFP